MHNYTNDDSAISRETLHSTYCGVCGTVSFLTSLKPQLMFTRENGDLILELEKVSMKIYLTLNQGVKVDNEVQYELRCSECQCLVAYQSTNTKRSLSEATKPITEEAQTERITKAKSGELEPLTGDMIYMIPHAVVTDPRQCLKYREVKQRLTNYRGARISSEN